MGMNFEKFRKKDTDQPLLEKQGQTRGNKKSLRVA